MSAPDFWENKEKAQEVVKALRAIRQEIIPLQAILKTYQDVRELCELASAENDAETLAELESELKALESQVEKVEFHRMLSGPHDIDNVYMSIHAGAGGTESCDWAAMLLRM